LAVIWSFEDTRENKRYEVRLAGSSLRLYTNGAFHSQYSPGHLFTGGVWDLLSIPALFQASPLYTNVLMLGVGGGTAIHQLNRLVNPGKIIGIELDPIHIQVAREYFGLTDPNLTLIEADARLWLKRSGARFNIIVDDLFVDAPDDPMRPFELNRSWMVLLSKRLRNNGIIVQNHLDRSNATKAADLISDNFRSALLFTVPHYENVVLALYREPVNSRKARALAIKKIQAIDTSAVTKLRFQVQQIY
jgi:spermidine synthase|tara:strand:- start:2715 stop:3455 length:741 start_codon:yes stop_codon:yes gene_type:complete